ncbi:MAG: hypothetical protein COV55_00030 [Candidatus Komeilibacteria bacterium CG11_big_fil_rev_8_21_14_0_20_36_20]|uniref:DUF1648 domain-containing protein n=1 Tax=Candidatus Komeilibacteria bacterium CG11_big_fil_rev_8_21_14_0_20_36_20 TaxID=1974477 RepID=A0A2H0NEP0_9BACT|nr:MAG: hypothetical protein COV55_00030 [Candidatus Komeilibacteria bacterium CG11_big_fil_rev_8_21_14_0_20_36_20]
MSKINIYLSIKNISMTQKEKILDLISLVVVLLMALSSWYFYDSLPEKIITHWNISGQPDGWGSRSSMLILIPAVALLTYLLFRFLPKIDPKKRNYSEFMSVYKIFQLVIILFFALIFWAMIMVNSGVNLSIGQIVPFLVGCLFIFLGAYFTKIKPNWFLGIRTPWTLSNDVVWQKTHDFGGKTFILGGILFIISAFLSPSWIGPLFIVIICLLLSSIVYSYFLYRKIGDKNDQK